MTPQLKDIINILDEIAPFSLAEEWDNPGFQVGYLSDEIKKALISLDPTINALKRAREINARLLLTHHPLIFNPLMNVDPDTYPGNVISESLKLRISIVSIHTNLDVAKGGINDILARMIGLQDMEALVKKDGSGDRIDGLGRIGCLNETMSLASVARIVMDSMGSTGLMVMGPLDREIKKIAILGGSGGSQLLHASEKDADLYITGDIRHHEALTAQTLGLALIDAGHFSMERAAMGVFADDLMARLKALDWDIDIEKYEAEKAPLRYLPRDEINRRKI